ncbi:GNVR domain-containing protein [Hoeflea olei]|nr:GNVR domain-containing protein [Hoeflea olei]
MSDSTKDRRPPARRGSLLDHAGEDSAAPAGAPDGPGMRAPASGGASGVRRPAPSLLSTPPARSPRLSTADYVPQRPAASDRPAVASPGPAAAPRPSPEPASEARNEPGNRPGPAAQDLRFGDRIARLIGAVPPRGREPAGEPSPEPLAARAEAPAPPPVPPAPEHRPQSAGTVSSWDGDDPAAPRYDRRRQEPYRWSAPAGGDAERPLLDASILVQAVVRYRKHIAAAAILGAVLGVAVALSTPHRYYAESRLFIDPREVRVTEDDIRNQQLSTEAMLAITDSQLQILSSTSVLEKVVTDLGLERDPEFNGSLSKGGISGGIALIKELVTGAGGPPESEQKALEKLRDSLSVSRDAKTFVIIVGVTSRDADKSALIANRIVETYLDSEGRAQSNLLERTSVSIDNRLNALRADLDAAERAVEKFKAENGLVGVGGQYIDDKVILALSDQLANARAMKVGIRVKANNLAKVNIDDVLSGAFPEELLSTNLTELRKQYTETKASADSLATGLGPRHPRYIAAKSSLDTIRNEISAELRRIVASSQTELQRAVETEQELASQMAVAKSRAMDQSVEFVTLRELERKAAATRGIYEAFLSRSRETSERSNLSTRNIRVISPAEPALQPMGPSRKLIAIGGLFAGLFAGIGLALLAGAFESIRAYNAGSVRARFQARPFEDYPVDPDPGPRPPSGGPSRNSHAENTRASVTEFDRAADQATAPAFAAPRAQEHSAAAVQTRPESAASDIAPVPAAATQTMPPPGWSSVAAAGLHAAAPEHAAPAPHAAPGFAAPRYAGSTHGDHGHGGAPAYPAEPAPWPQAAAPGYAEPPLSASQTWPAAAPAHPSYPPAPYPPAAPAQPYGTSAGYAAGWGQAPVPPRAQPGFAADGDPAPSHGSAETWRTPPAAFAASGFTAPGFRTPHGVAPVPGLAPAHAPAGPSFAPAGPGFAPAPSFARTLPVRGEAVDRIRRDMDALRARIAGYGASRRRG